MQPRRYLRTVVVLLVLDLLVASWFGLSQNGSLKANFAMVVHLLLSVWIGLVLNYTTRSEWKTWRIAIWTYWCLVALTLISMTMLLVPVQWTVTLVIFFKTSFVDAPAGLSETCPFQQPGEAATQAQVKIKKGRWPLWVSLGLLVAVILVNFLMAFADKSEFGGLALTMVHILFISAFFLVAPVLLRIPSDRNSRHAVIRLQYFIYALLALSWVLLLQVK